MRVKGGLVWSEGGEEKVLFRHVEFKKLWSHASVGIEKAFVMLVVSKLEYYTSAVYKAFSHPCILNFI